MPVKAFVRMAIARCRGGWPARERDARRHGRPPQDLAHGIEADVPAVWAGSEQPNRHAVGMPSLLSAIFIGHISELLLGSGPRDRGFESRLPDHSQRVHPSRPGITGDAISA